MTGKPRIIVLGNEKGGSGKSTTALHLSVALMRQGRRVGTLDLDARQGTLTRAVENRKAFAQERGLTIPMPVHFAIPRADLPNRAEAEADEAQRFSQALEKMADRDDVILDTPGSDSFLSRLGHTAADVLITPLNDSFIDLDLLARIDSEGKKILGPSVYSQMVWEQRQRRARAGLPAVDWIVMRNRLAHIEAHNKRRIGLLLKDLGKRLQFRQAPGFGERVIFRELFPKGLTVLDLREKNMKLDLNLSHVAARQEIRALLKALDL